MKINLGTNQALLVWISGTLIAAINAPVTSRKIETAICEHGSFEDVCIHETDTDIDFSSSFDWTETIEVTIKPDEEPENDYNEIVELTAITTY